jgi:hypothetical protein
MLKYPVGFGCRLMRIQFLFLLLLLLSLNDLVFLQDFSSKLFTEGRGKSPSIYSLYARATVSSPLLIVYSGTALGFGITGAGVCAPPEEPAAGDASSLVGPVGIPSLDPSLIRQDRLSQRHNQILYLQNIAG